MCPPPCSGRRRSSSSYSDRKKLPAIKTKISKREVDGIIISANYECLYQQDSSETFKPYEGSSNNLTMVLKDKETTVKVAGRTNKNFMTGFKTVIMDAPCFPAIFLLRVNEQILNSETPVR